MAIDYTNSMAIAGFVRESQREKMIAVGRYYADPMERFAEAAFTVHDRYQGIGIGTFLVNYLAWIAKTNNLDGFQAEVAGINPRMRHVLKRCFTRMEEKDLRDDGIRITLRFTDWKGHGNPARELAVSAVSTS